MLRDWDLPFPEAEAAFDHWRKQDRERIWRSIAEELLQSDINWRALQGEGIVFDVTLDSDTFKITPMMALDLRRSSVLIHPDLTVTVPVTPWEFRTAESLETIDASRGGLALLLENTGNFKRVLSTSPESVMKKLLADIADQLRADGKEWQEQYATAQEYDIMQLEDEYEKVLSELERSSTIREGEKIYQVLKIVSVAQSKADLSPEFRLRASLLIARVMQKEKQKDFWEDFKKALTNESPFKYSSINDQLLFGKSANELIQAIILPALEDNRDFIADALKKEKVPDQPSAIKTRHKALVELPRPDLVGLVGGAERFRSAMKFREMLAAVLNEFSAEGEVDLGKIESILDVTNESISMTDQLDIRDLQLNIRFLSFDSGRSRSTLGPIEGLKLRGEILSMLEDNEQKIKALTEGLEALSYGRDQNYLIARAYYDDGNYNKALELVFPKTIPLSLYPSENRQVLNEIKMIPDELVAEQNESGGVIISAIKEQEKTPLLQLDGLSKEQQEQLDAITLEQVKAWNEGEPLWEQALLTLVPAPPVLQKARELIDSDEQLRLAILKAMVYSCAMPAQDIIAEGGRCQKNAQSSTQLYDRVQQQSRVRFNMPSAEAMSVKIKKRYGVDIK
ncbi:MAG: hypothetical protein D3923_11750, partial [Candidatus Electrothrix sp. AR3]|nr:hypothetical protein [Candidatus Electrothrix sp. AR3]